MEIIAFHGWGFGSDFWNPWLKILPREVSFKTADRGYFDSKKMPVFSESDSLNILFLHSFGLHWCSQNLLDEAEFVVIFNGFQNIHPESYPLKSKSEKVLAKMISAFKKEPDVVLAEFWKNAFYPKKKSFKKKKEVNTDLLLRDLELLHSSHFKTEKLKDGKPIISLDGGRDKILGEPRGKIFTELTKKDAVYHFIKEAGHALPVTHTSDCWSFINAMIPIFRKNGHYRKQSYQ